MLINFFAIRKWCYHCLCRREVSCSRVSRNWRILPQHLPLRRSLREPAGHRLPYPQLAVEGAASAPDTAGMGTRISPIICFPCIHMQYFFHRRYEFGVLLEWDAPFPVEPLYFFGLIFSFWASRGFCRLLELFRNPARFRTTLPPPPPVGAAPSFCRFRRHNR
jgi:hypothetical protein